MKLDNKSLTLVVSEILMIENKVLELLSILIDILLNYFRISRRIPRISE
jgi:hypothetical protein